MGDNLTATPITRISVTTRRRTQLLAEPRSSHASFDSLEVAAKEAGKNPSKGEKARMKNAQKPDHVSLTALISRLKEGRFVIPDFQRDFEWNPWDISELM